MATSPAYKDSEEYKLCNAPLFSLNEIVAYSEYVPTANDKEHFRKFNREELTQMANQKYGSYCASNEKSNIEYGRYKQDCRKRALEVAERTVTQSQGGQISDAITTEADKYYNWLISIPQ